MYWILYSKSFIISVPVTQKYCRSTTFVTWGHTTWVISTVKICMFERSNEKSHFSKTKIYFHKKNYTTIIRTYWATKYESSRENEFWATCHKISNLFDGCWHPLLIHRKKVWRDSSSCLFGVSWVLLPTSNWVRQILEGSSL